MRTAELPVPQSTGTLRIGSLPCVPLMVCWFDRRLAASGSSAHAPHRTTLHRTTHCSKMPMKPPHANDMKGPCTFGPVINLVRALPRLETAGDSLSQHLCSCRASCCACCTPGPAPRLIAPLVKQVNIHLIKTSPSCRHACCGHAEHRPILPPGSLPPLAPLPSRSTSTSSPIPPRFARPGSWSARWRRPPTSGRRRGRGGRRPSGADGRRWPPPV